ncbi:hypothetical protein B0T22DRAFT_167617 [Podospora appendiculata]|uniref:Uncharacterized protein n=1 Tax=Podospora appendiculata TaxID=314037 RepID=A0AAE0XB97_9PEZI|nr:hypothetical protein B0T22DRAFT_167617 [Podospora appendiculata]
MRRWSGGLPGEMNPARTGRWNLASFEAVFSSFWDRGNAQLHLRGDKDQYHSPAIYLRAAYAMQLHLMMTAIITRVRRNILRLAWFHYSHVAREVPAFTLTRTCRRQIDTCQTIYLPSCQLPPYISARGRTKPPFCPPLFRAASPHCSVPTVCNATSPPVPTSCTISFFCSAVWAGDCAKSDRHPTKEGLEMILFRKLKSFPGYCNIDWGTCTIAKVTSESTV